MTLLMLYLWAVNGTLTAQANGGTESVLNVVEGPYTLHMALVLRTADGKDPVTNAAVSLTAVGPPPESLLVGPVHAFRLPTPPNWYDLNVTLPQEGEWRFMLDVVDVTEVGNVTRIEFPLEVQSGGVSWGIILVLISAIPALLAVAWYIRQSMRRRRSSSAP